MQAAAMPEEPRAAAGRSIFVGNSLQTSAYVSPLCALVARTNAGHWVSLGIAILPSSKSPMVQSYVLLICLPEYC